MYIITIVFSVEVSSVIVIKISSFVEGSEFIEIVENFMVEKSGVEKSGVGKFMVEKCWVESSGVEAWG